MLKRTLILLVLLLAQVGCGAEWGEGLYPYAMGTLTDKTRLEVEHEKREILQIEDLRVGDGSIAAWNRRVTADIEVRYLDGSVVYKGPVFTYIGFHAALYGRFGFSKNFLSSGQNGLELGLNGMSVGGRRRFTINRKLACAGIRDDAGTEAGCPLVNAGQPDREVRVRKQDLIVEAVLTESCVPITFRAIRWSGGSYVINREIWCRNSDIPKNDPTLPIWHVY